jgi:hypothetical protein
MGFSMAGSTPVPVADLAAAGYQDGGHRRQALCLIQEFRFFKDSLAGLE